MKCKILIFLTLLLMGCNDIDKNNYPSLNEAEARVKNEVVNLFKNFTPIKSSELITTKYILLTYSLNNYSKSDDLKLRAKLLSNGWILKTNKNNVFYCNKGGDILETVEPYDSARYKLESIVAEQSKTEWLIGYSYRYGGNWECDQE